MPALVIGRLCWQYTPRFIRGRGCDDAREGFRHDEIKLWICCGSLLISQTQVWHRGADTDAVDHPLEGGRDGHFYVRTRTSQSGVR